MRDIATPTLVVRGELDFCSRPEDAATLATERVNAPVVQTVTIPEATHDLFNNRPRSQRIEKVLTFLRR
ncbi:hypothetical protein IQ267_24945 [filamentous cyanobacterium LEGE 07170]|nr:hypothetical protein [filamentous cyanobacterium LEGE 07170]